MVKTYHELSDEDRKLLNFYMKYNKGYDLLLMIFSLFMTAGFMIYALGILFLDIGTILVGVITINFMIIALLWMGKRKKKENLMVFGFDDISKHFFDIDKKDLRISVKEFLTDDKEGVKTDGL